MHTHVRPCVGMNMGTSPGVRPVCGTPLWLPRGMDWCAVSVCVQNRSAGGQRDHCVTLPTQALLPADITAALNTDA